MAPSPLEPTPADPSPPTGRDLVSPVSYSRRFIDELQTRLRETAIALITAWTIWNLGYLQADQTPPTLVLLFATIKISIGVVIFIVLWRRTDLSLRTLRLLEACLFTVGCLYNLFNQDEWIRADWHLDVAMQGQEGKILYLVTDEYIVPFCALIVIYGTFVPNDSKRCLRAILLMLPWTYLLTLYHATQHASVRAHLGLMFLEMTFMLAIASAIALYGNLKFSKLFRRAIDAEQHGNYRLVRKLGEGGMGEVYLASHWLLRRLCTIKLVRAGSENDPHILARFEREVQAMAALTHPNVVDVYDYGQTEDGAFYYVMEYVPGLTLEALVKQHGHLSAGRVVHFLVQACSALNEAHSRGLIHRDIKPSNILVGERGAICDFVKLFDFGLVQFRPGILESGSPRMMGPRLTAARFLVGTPLYMSPEQAAGDDHIDGRSDLYSLALAAYFLLTARNPFDRATIRDIITAQVMEPPTPPSFYNPDVPDDLEAVLLRCLNKDRSKRPANALSLEQELRQCACANDWTREDAAKWWREHAPPPETFEAASAIAPALAVESR